ncbi:MAG: hypothetical protein MJ214_04025 [Bacilli bacterium]|nr:hypothetical protein [Bacilli bacterium]
MKKVLVLSALGCVATIGAVFAAFTLDPTNESKEIPSVNVDVDLSSHVFSTFERIYKIDYEDYEDGANQLWKDVTISEPKYHFKPKNIYSGSGAIVGTTLDLHCDDYDIGDMSLYCQKREDEPDPSKTEEHAQWEKELAELAPTGYAFKYEYDNDFLTRIKVDDKRPGDMQEWEYAIYKTNFSSGLTKSDFKAKADSTRTEDPHGLDEFGIHYQDPDATKPNYKEFVWDKSSLDRDAKTGQYPWISGNPYDPSAEDAKNPGFYIQPNVDDNGRPLNSGVIFFTGAELTENLFAGNFTDEAAVKACEEYLNETEEGSTTKFLHRNFALKIKASEYFKVESHELNPDGTAKFVYYNNSGSGEPMASGNRYSFSFEVDEETDQLFKDGFEIDKFVITNQSDQEPLLLLTEEAAKAGDVDALGLKVMLDSPGNGVSDITRFFKYSTDRGDQEHYASIYFDDTVALNAVGDLPEKGDKITFNFVFRQTTGKVEREDWFAARLNLNKPIKKFFELQDGGSGTYVFAPADPVSMPKGGTYRFEALYNMDKYFNTLSFTNNGEPVAITSEIAKPYFVDQNGGIRAMPSEYYAFNDDGTLTFYDELIRSKEVFNEGDRYAVDIRNNDEATPLVVSRAELTTAPAPRRIQFNSYTPGGELLSTGHFMMIDPGDSVRSIHSGVLLSFDVFIDDDKFWDSLNAFIADTTGYTAKLTFALLDDSLDPIPMAAGTPVFTVKRLNKMGELISTDTTQFEYSNGVISTKGDGADYLKTWKREDACFHLVIDVNYEGEEVKFKGADFAFEITEP